MGQPRRFSYTTQFFSGELSEEHYWVLGWLYSDGYNSGTGISVTVQEQDLEVLEKIVTVMRGGKTFHRLKQKAYDLKINSIVLSERLAELGCIKRKSLVLTYPSFISKIEDHRAFLRGVFEGDGSIYRLGHRLSAKAEIASGSVSFINSLKEIIERLIGIKCTIRHTSNKSTCGRLILGNGYQGAYAFLSFIYDTPRVDLTLKRKYDKWLELNSRVQNPPSKRTWNINKDRCHQFVIKSPDGTIYDSNTMYPFAKEYGLDNGNLAKVVAREYGFKSIKGWTPPTDQEVNIARLSGSIVYKNYVHTES